MRIIGGVLKGKKIIEAFDKNTRPLKDLVKESIFNLIEHSNKLNLTFHIKESEKFYVERVNIFGNNITEEQVIRNEFIIDESFNSPKPENFNEIGDHLISKEEVQSVLNDNHILLNYLSL